MGRLGGGLGRAGAAKAHRPPVNGDNGLAEGWIGGQGQTTGGAARQLIAGGRGQWWEVAVSDKRDYMLTWERGM